jgi:hypothetical protein
MTLELGGLMGKVAALKSVKELVRQGQQAEATQLYQEAMGASAEEAGEVVGRLASGQGVVLSSSSVTTSIPLAFGSQIQITSDPQVAEALRKQLDTGQRLQRRLGRIVIGIILGAVLVGLIFFALVFFALR